MASADLRPWLHLGPSMSFCTGRAACFKRKTKSFQSTKISKIFGQWSLIWELLLLVLQSLNYMVQLVQLVYVGMTCANLSWEQVWIIVDLEVLSRRSSLLRPWLLARTLWWIRPEKGDWANYCLRIQQMAASVPDCASNPWTILNLSAFQTSGSHIPLTTILDM